MNFRPRNRAFWAGMLFWSICAFLAGTALAKVAGLVLDRRNIEARVELSRTGSARIPTALTTKGPERDIEAFLEMNPFGLVIPASGSDPSATQNAGSLELIGTFPPVGALFRVEGSARAVLVGRKIGSETLKKVKGTRVTLTDGPRTRTLDLLYTDITGSPAIPAPSPQSRRPVPPARTRGSGIESPSGGQDGTIERDLINKLLMDPYQELSRVRLRPKIDEDGTPQGIEAQWLHKDSLLLSMGLQSGDVIHSVNDIPIRTTSDIVNAMNSMLNSDRFVIAFYRDGTDSQVAYSVK